MTTKAATSATGDPDRLLQALSNLLENALRATPRGGTVCIVARPGRLDAGRHDHFAEL